MLMILTSPTQLVCAIMNCGERDSQQSQHHAKPQTDLTSQNPDALRALQQAIELVEDADTSASECSQGRSRHPEPWIASRTDAQSIGGVWLVSAVSIYACAFLQMRLRRERG